MADDPAKGTMTRKASRLSCDSDSSTRSTRCPASRISTPDSIDDLFSSAFTFSRSISWDQVSTSQMSSWLAFADADQTLIFFDWDDTLFPTTEFVERWGVKIGAGESSEASWQESEEHRELVEIWQQALLRYLTTACSLGRVVIVTNSRSPWVENCIEQFVPQLKPLFDSSCGPKVVYARELYQDMIRRKKIRQQSPVPAKHVLPDLRGEGEAHEDLMKAKYYAMRQEAGAFYRQYTGQSWKNILSLGDMAYEHEAVQELGLRRCPSHAGERLRIKSLLLPGSASLSELALRLNFSCLMLPVYVRFDGDFKVNLRECRDPPAELAKALGIPELADIEFPLHAWGLGDAPSSEDAIQEALGELAVVVKD